MIYITPQSYFKNKKPSAYILQVYITYDLVFAKDKGLAAKVKQFFQDVAKLIRSTVSAYRDAVPDSPEGRLIRKLEDIHSQLQEVFAEGVMDAGENFQNAENTTNEGGVRYSFVKPFVDNSGTHYDNAVLLDSEFFNDLKPSNWGKKLKKFVDFRSTIDPVILPVQDENGVYQQLELAKVTDRVYDSNNSPHRVLNELSHTKDNISKLSVIHIDEIVEISEEDNPYFTVRDPNHSHKWLDQNGWLHRIAHVINAKNGAIYKIVVDIAKAADGRHIMYATKGKINRVGTVLVNSLVTRGSGLNTNSATSLSQKDPTVKRKDLEYLFAVDQKDMKTAQRMVLEAAVNAGYATRGYHGSRTPGFTVAEKYSWLWLARDKSVAETYGTHTDVDNTGKPHSKKGVYDMVYNLGNNLRIEADGNSWGELPINADEYPGVYADEETGDITTNAMAEWAEHNGYDSITFVKVMDGGGSPTTVDVIFNPNRDAKSADPVTYDDDGNVIPLSERFNSEKKDIRYSVGQKTDDAVQALLEKENGKLREDVARLKELLKLQGKQTHGSKFKPSSVEAAARYLKKNAGAKGDTKELAGLLDGFYGYVAKGDITWEDIREKAKPIANWLMDHVEHGRSAYAQEVLDQIKGSRIYLDESQMQKNRSRNFPAPVAA